MNRHKPLLKIIMFVFASLTLLLLGAQAQSSLIDPGDVLIYFRTPGQTGEYIRLSLTFRQVYNLPLDKCSLRSLDGTYVAQAPLPGNSGELIVRRLATQQIIIQTPWQANWEACYIRWSTDSVLAIRQHGTLQDFFHFDVSSGNLVPVGNPYSPPQYPPLPGWIPSIQTNFILPSPQANIYLYERCTGQQTDPAGDICASASDFVIYDAAQQQVLHVLQNPDGTLIRGYIDSFPPSLQAKTYPSAAWSATGRYLAFQHYGQNPYDYFTLSVYDVTANQYLNTIWVNARIDYQRAMQWSPQGNKLALWSVGRFGENQPDDDLRTQRTPVIFDADTGQFLHADQPFNMTEDGGGKAFTWSPDGQALVFVAGNGDLIYMDANSGATTPLDNSVHEVITWKHEALPPTPTPTPTATLTPTP